MKTVVDVTVRIEVDIPSEGMTVEMVEEIEGFIQDRIASKDTDLFELQDVEMESV